MKIKVLFSIAIVFTTLMIKAQCAPSNTIGLIVTSTTLITQSNPTTIKICSTGNAYDTTGNSGRIYFLEAGAKLTLKLNSTTAVYMKTGSILKIIGNDNSIISSEPSTTLTGVTNPVTSCSLITFPSSPACQVNGINDQSYLSNLIEFYPNPVKNNLNFNNRSSITLSFQIINALGQKVNSFNIESGRKSFEISELSDGIYFVVIHDNNKLVSTRKLIVTK